MIKKVSLYFVNVKKEMSKVSWPSQPEVVDFTLITVFLSLLLMGFAFGLDKLYSFILQIIY